MLGIIAKVFSSNRFYLLHSMGRDSDGNRSSVDTFNLLFTLVVMAADFFSACQVHMVSLLNCDTEITRLNFTRS